MKKNVLSMKQQQKKKESITGHWLQIVLWMKIWNHKWWEIHNVFHIWASIKSLLCHKSKEDDKSLPVYKSQDFYSPVSLTGIGQIAGILENSPVPPQSYIAIRGQWNSSTSKYCNITRSLHNLSRNIPGSSISYCYNKIQNCIPIYSEALLIK